MTYKETVLEYCKKQGWIDKNCNNISSTFVANIIHKNIPSFCKRKRLGKKKADKVISKFYYSLYPEKKPVKKRNIIKKTEKRPFAYIEFLVNRDAFFKSDEWRQIRYYILKENGGHCCLCGRTVKDGVKLHVDHIIPISKDWSKRLDKDNLQVLCEDCNIGKSNKDDTDWR